MEIYRAKTGTGVPSDVVRIASGATKANSLNAEAPIK